MTQRWAQPTRYTLRRNTASIKKDLICHYFYTVICPPLSIEYVRDPRYLGFYENLVSNVPTVRVTKYCTNCARYEIFNDIWEDMTERASELVKAILAR